MAGEGVLEQAAAAVQQARAPEQPAQPARAELAPQPQPQPDLIFAKSGNPYKSEPAAKRAASQNPGTEIVAVEGGWALRKTEGVTNEERTSTGVEQRQPDAEGAGPADIRGDARPEGRAQFTADQFRAAERAERAGAQRGLTDAQPALAADQPQGAQVPAPGEAEARPVEQGAADRQPAVLAPATAAGADVGGDGQPIQSTAAQPARADADGAPTAGQDVPVGAAGGQQATEGTRPADDGAGGAQGAARDFTKIYRDAYLKAHGQDRAMPEERYARSASYYLKQIEAKDADALRRSNIGDAKSNPAIRALFEAATGITLPKGRRATENVIDQWAGVSSEERARRSQSKKDSIKEESERRELIGAKKAANLVEIVDKEGSKQQGADYVDSLIDQGFNRVVQRGPATWLAKDREDGTADGWKMPHKFVAEYARRRVREINSEQAKANRSERTAQPAAAEQSGQAATAAAESPAGSLGSRWDSMTAAQREAAAVKAGWSTAKGGPNFIAKRLSKQSWAEITPGSRATLERLAGQGEQQAATAQPKPARETITPSDDAVIGKNSAGETLYERRDGSRYRMRFDRPGTRPNGYPDFGGDLAPVDAPQPEPAAQQATEQRPEAFEHAGLRIYPINVRSEGRSEPRWAVQLPENRGTDKVLGDTLHRTVEEAKASAERESARFEADQARETAANAEREQREAQDASRKAANRGKSINELRADATLDKAVTENGKTTTRREWVEAKVQEGLEPRVTQEDKIKPMSRTAFNRATNEEQRAHERRVKAAGKKDVHWIGDYTVTKAEHDYAVSLREKVPERQEAAPPQQPAEPAQEAPAAPEQQPAAEAPAAPARIENFGEALPGGRAEAKRALDRELTREDIEKLPLSKIWPLSDIEKIEDKFQAALAYAIRGVIPTKPQKGGSKLRIWVDKVQAARGWASMMLSLRDREALIGLMRENSRALEGFAAKVEMLDAIERDQWKRIGEVREYPDAYRFNEASEREPAPFVAVEIDGKRQTFLGAKAIADVMDRVSEMLSGSDGKKRMKFEIRRHSTTGVIFINKAGDKERRRLKTFEDADAARAFLRDNYDELVAAWDAVKDRDNVNKADTRREQNRARTGADRRNGQDASDTMFQDAFGFRGVEFGKWVSQGKGAKERQGLINDVYDAFMDLADITGLPPRAMSLGGTLGLALGSRGKGWASAHFEPGNLVINLTKTRGAGALAHEWFHALDNYFARQRGGEVPMQRGMKAKEAYRANNFITYRPEPMLVHKTQASTPMTKSRLAHYQQISKGAEYYKAENWQVDPKHPQGVRTEVERGFAELVEALDNSPMTPRSRANDKTEDGYWGQILERAARAFENFTIARMMEKGYQNDFLANVTPIEDFQRSADRYPYLLPEEIAPIAQAFDNLFGTIRVRNDAGKSILFSRRDTEATPSAAGMRRQVIEGMANRIAGNWTVPVRVVETPQDLPAAIQAAAGDGLAGVDGVIDGEAIYLVASNITSPRHALTVLAHEGVGHFGMEGLLGDRFQQTLDDVIALRDAGKLDQAVVDQLAERYADVDDATWAKEAIAVMAERGVENSVMARVIAAAKRMLRELGFKVQFSESDLRAMIGDAARFVRDGEGRRNLAAAQFSRAQQDQTQTPEFKRWFGDSKVVDAEGRPLVVYHGTRGDFDIFDAARQGQSDFGASGRGFYFSQDAGTANVYASLSPGDGSPNIMPVYLSVLNPYEMGARLPQSEAESRTLTERVKAEGHDGIIVRGADGVMDEIVVFRPEQIKSATGNQGAFDPADPRINFSFAGMRSRTADARSSLTAMSRISKGEDAETVRRETGWFQGADGRWRYEISDRDAKIKLADRPVAARFDTRERAEAANNRVKGRGVVQVGGRWSFIPNRGPETIGQALSSDAGGEPIQTGTFPTTVGRLLDHPALFAAYPELRMMRVGLLPPSSRSRGRVSADGIYLREDLSMDEARSTLLHELQHGIQHIEDFATGGNLDYVRNLQEYREAIADGATPPDMAAFEVYRRLAGEVEARNVQARAQLSDEYIKIFPPEMTADVPASRVIVVMNGRPLKGAPPPANDSISVTETPEFRRWFGDSKVVDADGRPLVVYHGTGPGGVNIEAFLPADPSPEATNQNRSMALVEKFREAQKIGGRIGYMEFRSGTFFSPDPSYAGNYTADSTGVMYPVYIRAENPIYFDMATRKVSGGAAGVTPDALILVEGDRINEIAVLDPTQVKSATGNRGTFDPADPRITFSRRAPTFYSAAVRAIEEGKGAPKRAAAGPWKQWLDGAVRRGEMKQSERDWLDIDGWLDRQDGPVTREALSEFVRANEVQVSETVLGEGPPIDIDAMTRKQLDDLYEREVGYRPGEDDPSMSLDELRGMVRETITLPEMQPAGAVKFGGWRTPGGENYRELLLTLPRMERTLKEVERDVAVREGWSFPLTGEQESAVVREWKQYTRESADFNSRHWSQPNVLAHIRMDERTDADGKRVLFLQEIQSDWHQAGRKKGYKSPADQEVAKARVFEQNGNWRIRGVYDPSVKFDTREAAEAFAVETIGRNGKVPDAPLKQTDEWSMLAFKRAARWAVDNGFERIAWATGEQNAELFDLSKQVDRVAITPTGGVWAVTAWKDGTRVVSKDARDESELSGLVGKDLAERAVKENGGDYSGLDLKVGGAGMRGFYDKILPAAVNKWGKKFGVKAGEAYFSPNDPNARGVEGWREINEMVAIGGSPVHAIDITPAMREAVEGGQPLFSRRQPADFSRAVTQAAQRAPAWGSIKDSIANVNADARPAWLKALTRQQIVDVGRDQFDVGGRNLAADFEQLAREMEADANSELSRPIRKDGRSISDIAEDWAKMSSVLGGDRKAVGAMATLMHDTTLAGIDPSAPMLPGTDERAYRALKGRFDALPKRAQALYRDVRDAYAKRREDFLKALEGRIMAAGGPEGGKRAMIDQLREQFESARVKGPYFPLARFGDYWVRAKKADGTTEFVMTETQREQRAEAQRLRAEGYSVKLGKSIRGLASEPGVAPGIMGDLAKMLDEEAAAGRIAADGLESMKDGLYQMFLQSLPEQSVRKHFIHRKGTAGFSQDALRAFSHQMGHGSKQLARVRYAHRLSDTLREMRTAAEDAPDPNKAADIVKALDDSFAWMMNPTNARWANWATSLGFTWYLGVSPAAAIVNLTQTPIVTLPVLAAKHGAGKSAMMLAKSLKDYLAATASKSKRKALDSEFSGDMGRMLKEMEESGALERTMTMSLFGLSDAESATAVGGQRVMRGIGFLFHQAELANRESTAIAAYRLAREAGQSHDSARSYAYNAVFESHFDYSSSNRANFMRGNVARVILLFRQYSQNITYYLIRNAYQVFQGATPAEKKEAATKLFGTLGMTFAAAGAMGLPGYGMMTGIASMLQAMFGDDDEPWDPDVAFRQWLSESTNPQIGEMIARGVANQTGVNIADRTTLGDLWIRDPGRDLEGRDLVWHYLEQLLGPVFGIGIRGAEGVRHWQDGQPGRGFEKMIPKFAADPIKAWRFSKEGATTLRGDPVMEEFTMAELIWQSQGFSPAALADQYTRNRQLKNAEQFVLDRRSSLLNAYAMAMKAGDDRGRADTLQMIRRFNQRWPQKAITADTIRDSMRTRARFSARALSGVGIDPKLAAELQEMVAY
jgi:hypothetical protein